MTAVYDCSVESELLEGLRAARGAIGRGELVVIPTDTVYGLAADAFRPAAVQRLLEAKESGRDVPPTVLIPGIPTLNALAENVPELGETRGTVALRMPDNPHTRHLLADTGPLAVSSANIAGMPAATSAADALAMLGDRVSVYLDGGVLGGSVPGGAVVGDGDPAAAASTVVDATSLHLPEGRLRILRDGAVTREAIVDDVGAELVA